MIGRFLQAFGRSERAQTGFDEYSECTCCPAAFDDWITDCPVCDRLVHPIVVPPP